MIPPSLDKIIMDIQKREDAWEARLAEKQAQIDRWIRSCLEVQQNWEEEHRKLSAAEDELAVKDARILELERRYESPRQHREYQQPNFQRGSEAGCYG